VGNESMVRQLRRRAGLTQEELAQLSGISVRTIRGLETGRRRNPRFASVRQLSDAMGLAPAERDELMAAIFGGLTEHRCGEVAGRIMLVVLDNTASDEALPVHCCGLAKFAAQQRKTALDGE
jgi:transcriptional regulator with XRE-family HTH domain